MKAAILHKVDDLRVEEVDKPVPQKNEALVKVLCCGICSSDVARIKRDGTHHFPTIPGHEFSGTDETGELFAVYPLLPCYKCYQCKQHRYQCCSNYNYTGSRCDGGFAEYIKVPRQNLIPVPKGVSAQEAAMTEPAAVGMHAIRIAGIKSGDVVIIIGCGTIGLITAQIARAKGALKVIPIDIDEERLSIARSLGFKEACSSEDNSKQIIDSDADVVFEMVGRSATYNLTIDLVKSGGKVIFTGNISDDLVIPRERVSLILRKELTIHGTWNSTALGEEPTDWQEVLKLQSNGEIDLKPLINHQISLDELPNMIERMAEGKETVGKVIVNID